MRATPAVAVTALVALAAYIAAAPHLPGPASGDLAVSAQGVAGLVPMLAATAALSLALPGPRTGLVAAGGGVVVAVAAAVAGVEAIATPARVVAAAGVGIALASMAATPRQLAGLAVLAAVVDSVSVAVGPTGYAADSAPALLEAAGLLLPGWGGPPDGLLGVVDAVFLALFVRGAADTGLRTTATATWCAVGVGGALVLAVALDTPIPAIPAICAGFLAVNRTRFSARTGSDGPASV